MKHIQVTRPTFLAGKPVKVGDEFKGDEITQDHIALVFAGKAKCMDKPKTAQSDNDKTAIASKDAEIAELTTERDNLQADLDSANEKLAGAEGHDAAIAEKDQTIAQLQADLKSVQDDKDVLEDKLNEQVQAVEDKTSELADANARIAELEKPSDDTKPAPAAKANAKK